MSGAMGQSGDSGAMTVTGQNSSGSDKLAQRQQQQPRQQLQHQPQQTPDLVWSKLQILSQRYFQDMHGLLTMLTQKSTQVMPPEQLQKLQHYKNVLQQMMLCLSAPKEKVPKEFTMDKVGAMERQIVNILGTFVKRKSGLQGQHGQTALQVQQQPMSQSQVQQPSQQQLSAQQIPDAAADSKDPKMLQVEQHQHQLLQRQLQQQQVPTKVNSPQMVSSPQIPQAPSPQTSQQLSPQFDQQSFGMPSRRISKVATPIQAGTPPLGTSSPMLAAASPLADGVDIRVDVLQTLSSGSPAGDTTASETVEERFLRKIDSVSPEVLRAAVNDMKTVASMIDMFAASAPGNDSRSAIGENLAAVTRTRLQARGDKDGLGKRKRSFESVTMYVNTADGKLLNSLSADPLEDDSLSADPPFRG